MIPRRPDQPLPPSEPGTGEPGTGHLTALAPPEQLVDWRLALAYEAIARTGVLSALPGTLDELAAAAGLDRSGLRAVLQIPLAAGLLELDGEDRYRPGPSAPSETEGAALAQHGSWIRRWAALVPERLRDRTASSPLEPERPDPATGLRLLEAASLRSVRPVVDACLSAVPETRRVLDLGGGHGAYALELRRRGCEVTMQDLPVVIEAARADGRLPDAGVELFAADVFERVAPGPYDLMLCSTVTNMFDAERNLELFRQVRPRIASGGALAVVSYLRERGPVGAAFGVQMLVATPGGDAHGEAEYRDWLGRSGYGAVDVRHLESPPLTVLVARPS